MAFYWEMRPCCIEQRTARILQLSQQHSPVSIVLRLTVTLYKGLCLSGLQVGAVSGASCQLLWILGPFTCPRRFPFFFICQFKIIASQPRRPLPEPRPFFLASVQLFSLWDCLKNKDTLKCLYDSNPVSFN